MVDPVGYRDEGEVCEIIKIMANVAAGLYG